MTTTLTPVPVLADSAIWTIGAPRLLAGLDRHDLLDQRAHLAVHGALPGSDLPRLLTLVDATTLTGRGGAGFPLAAKLRALHGTHPSVVVNGSESEPASHKDRTLLRRTPHLVLDGALAVAEVVDARRITVAVHDVEAASAVRTALAQRPDGHRVHVQMTPADFVAGEARALVRGLHGGPPLPPGRREHLTERGVLVANAETFAQTAVLLRLGARRFADTGTRAEPGTTLLTVGGAVGRPGVVEIPLGTPLGIVLTAARAEHPWAVVTGGYHGSWLAPIADIQLSRAGLASAGGTLGAGVLLVLDGATCALGELSRVADWLAGESAKQCGPCRFGLPALAADVRAICRGDAAAVGTAFGHARAVDGRGACTHPDGAARFVTSGLHLLHDETDLHLRGGCGRPVRGQLPIGVSR
jgi:NADH:ubiquinone oxidoreductase subunit F (NADH-binding)